jgi:hypothetical protein
MKGLPVKLWDKRSLRNAARLDDDDLRELIAIMKNRNKKARWEALEKSSINPKLGGTQGIYEWEFLASEGLEATSRNYLKGRKNVDLASFRSALVKAGSNSTNPSDPPPVKAVKSSSKAGLAICGDCGNQLRKNGSLCERCGNSAIRSAPAQTPSAPIPGSGAWNVIVFVLMYTGLMASIMWIDSWDTQQDLSDDFYMWGVAAITIFLRVLIGFILDTSGNTTVDAGGRSPNRIVFALTASFIAATGFWLLVSGISEWAEDVERRWEKEQSPDCVWLGDMSACVDPSRKGYIQRCLSSGNSSSTCDARWKELLSSP